MTITYNPSLLANLNNPTTAVTTINNNETAVASAFTSALNVTGDQMKGILDMNNNQIINLPAPTSNNSPARLVDVAPAGTTLIGAVTYNNIQSLPANTILGNPTGATANATAQTSVSVVNATFTASVGTATLNASTVNATTGNLTNINATNVIAANSVSGNFVGYNALACQTSTTGASTGTMGEYLSVFNVVPTNLANNTPVQVTSNLTLQPGDWEISANATYFAPIGNGISFIIAICNTPNSFSNTIVGGTAEVSGTSLGQIVIATLPCRQLINSAQTYTVNVAGVVAANTMTCTQALIQARRWR